MVARDSLLGRVIALGLAFSFLFATSPDAYGLDRCPYHGEEEGRPAAGDAHSGANATHHDTGGGDDECMWRVDCHACVHSPLHVSGTAASLLDGSPRVPSDAPPAAPGVLGPRHGLFELYLPNAPPL